jgi:hypothetical protein
LQSRIDDVIGFVRVTTLAIVCQVFNVAVIYRTLDDSERIWIVR